MSQCKLGSRRETRTLVHFHIYGNGGPSRVRLEIVLAMTSLITIGQSDTVLCMWHARIGHRIAF